MINYEDIIENPLFFKWIFNPTPELDFYWEDYIERNLKDAPLVLELKSKLVSVNVEDNKLSEVEKLKLAYDISKKLDVEDKRNRRNRLVVNLMKYAAIAVLFFFIGATIVYLNIEEEDLGQYISQMKPPSATKGPVLILPEGRNVAINNGESTLDYRSQGEITINNDSVITTFEPSKINQLLIPHGSSSKVVLSDNSIVWLNAGSSLIYPSVFDHEIREVVLFGEAYFNVSKDNKKPFIVRTTELEIQVLGTQFNVSAYQEENVIQAVLKEGSVAIRKAGTKESKDDIILRPNQLISFDKSTQIAKVTNVNTDFYTLWTDGLLCFEKLDLNRVVKKIERYYDIAIQFEDPMTGTIRISGKLDLKQNKEEVFKYLSLVSYSEIEQKNEKYFLIK